MNDRVQDMLKRIGAMGIGLGKPGPRPALTERGGYAVLVERRIVALGMIYGPEEREATAYAVWLRRQRGFRCAYCGKRVGFAQRRIDHLMPLAAGGRHVPENLGVAGREDVGLHDLGRRLGEGDRELDPLDRDPAVLLRPARRGVA